MSYSQLLCPETKVHETSHPYLYITERHLQAVWFEQKYFKNLKTTEGQTIEVISPGIWNSEAGPDFKKAHFLIGGKEIKGDVEIHLSETGWEQHNHHHDPRYNDVVLHLSLWGSNKKILTQQGRQIQTTLLKPFLTIPLQRIVNYIDLDLYPYKKFLGAGTCATALFQNLESKKIETFFKQAAEWRLIQKRNLLLSRTNEPGEAMLAGIAQGLGYKNNAQSFLELFLHLKERKDENFDNLLAYSLGIIGFFDPKFQQKWGKSPLYKHLFSLFQPTAFRIPLVLNQIRPLNHPIRRLVYLIKLIQDPQRFTLYNKLASLCKDEDLTPMLEAIPNFEDPYWNTHFLFEDHPKTTFIPLIGNNLKKEILINTFLPLMFHEISPNDLEKFRSFYHSFSPLKSGKTKYLIHRFFGDSTKGSILNKAYTEQGAYQVHRDFCIHYEASCEGCPFVERYKSLFK